MNDHNGPDAEHDAWLREALRHAPDAGVAPPPSVSEMILREAQAKARAGAPAPSSAAAPAGGFAAFWAWLARPQVAAGAASVMIATVAGVMWWDRPIDDDRGPPLASAPAPAPQAAPVRAPEVVAPPAPAAAPAPAPAPAPAIAAPVSPPAPMVAGRAEGLAKSETAAKRAAPPRDAAAQDSRQAQQHAAGRADKERARRDAPEAGLGAAAPRPELAAQPRPFPAAAEPSADRSPSPGAGGTTAETANAVAAAKPTAPAAAVAPPAMAPAPATAAPVLRERSEGMARDTTTPQRYAPLAAQKSTGALSTASGPAPSDLGALRQAIAAEPQRWSWQRGSGSPQPVNPRLRDWLAQADAAAAPSWRRDQAETKKVEQQDTVAGSTSSASPHELRLLRDGRLVATLRLDGRVLHLENIAAEGQPSTTQQAELDPSRAQALQQSSP